MTQIQKRPDQVGSVVAMLEKNRAGLEAALPKHFTSERMIRLVSTTLRKTPALLQGNQASLMGAIITAAQLGLEIDVLGMCYLVKYKSEVQLIVGYKGLIALARRSGQISMIYATEVRENDEFKVSQGTSPSIEHTPANANRGEITHTYAVAMMRDGGTQFEVMDVEELEAFQSGLRGGGGNGPWRTHRDQMRRKTVLKRLCKMLPMSIEAQQAVAIDELADVGKSQGLEHLATWAEDVAPSAARNSFAGPTMALGTGVEESGNPMDRAFDEMEPPPASDDYEGES